MASAPSSLWELAFEDLEKDQPDLTEALHSHATHSQSSPEQLAFVANETVNALQDDRKSTKSGKFRHYFEETVKYILAAKDYVSAAAEVNPYTSVAWSAVCLILPLITKPTEENEAAVKGLDVIANLFIVYRWKEKTYRKGNSAADFDQAARELYKVILEYEGSLLVHMRHKAVHRFASDVLDAGKWEALTEKIQGLAANCHAVTEAMSRDFAEDWRFEEKKWQEELLQQPRFGRERENIRSLYSLYEEGKNANPARAPKTGEWFLTHPSFLTWREATVPTMLWLSADAGCGKSVLSKHLVDRKGEVVSVRAEPPTFCYFFFKDDDNGDQRNDACVAIRALLHQLFLQRQELYGKHAEQSFETKGTLFLKDSLDTLWGIFEACIMDESLTEVVCILDALDECSDRNHHRRKLIKNLIGLHQRTSRRNSGPVCKLLLTSRPQWDIERDLKPLTDEDPMNRIFAEDETDTIKKEIDYVIDIKVEELTESRDLDWASSQVLSRRLKETKSRTYLWLHLALDVLENELDLSSRNIERVLGGIPLRLEEAYTKMLSRSPQPEIARKLLHIVLAATRPLTTNELAVAVAADSSVRNRHELSAEIRWSEHAARTHIKNLCGLLLTVVDSKVYLIHQTAKIFLTRPPHARPPSPPDSPHLEWKESFDLKESNLILAKACVYFLLLDDFSNPSCRPGSWMVANTRAFSLYNYAASNWGLHFRQAGSLTALDTLLLDAVTSKLYLPPIRLRWSGIYTDIADELVTCTVPVEGDASLWAAHFGHFTALQHLIGPSTDPDLQDRNGRTALMFAADSGDIATVQVLLDEGADMRRSDKLGQIPLAFATQNDRGAVMEALIRAGSPTDPVDFFGRKPAPYDKSGNSSQVHKDGSAASICDLDKDEARKRLDEFPDCVRLYFETRLQEGFWVATDSNSHLFSKDATRPTNLSEFADEMSATFDAALLSDNQSLKLARRHLLRALDCIADAVATESPAAILHFLRTIAGCSHRRLSHLRESLCQSISYEADRALREEDPFRKVLNRLRELLGTSNAALDTHIESICVESIESAAQVLSKHLGPYHMQSVYTRATKIALRSRLSEAGVMHELRALSSDVDAKNGKSSPQALMVLSTLGKIQLRTKDWKGAEASGREMVHCASQLLASKSGDVKRFIYLLCEGYAMLGEAQGNQGELNDAETSFEMAAQQARQKLGANNARARKHKDFLNAWLVSQGRLR